MRSAVCMIILGLLIPPSSLAQLSLAQLSPEQLSPEQQTKDGFVLIFASYDIPETLVCKDFSEVCKDYSDNLSACEGILGKKGMSALKRLRFYVDMTGIKTRGQGAPILHSLTSQASFEGELNASNMGLGDMYAYKVGGDNIRINDITYYLKYMSFEGEASNQ